MLTGSAGLRLVAAIVAVLAGVLLWPSPLPQEPLLTLQGDEGDSGLKAWLDAGGEILLPPLPPPTPTNLATPSLPGPPAFQSASVLGC